jgi:hypothetical protein
MILNVAGRLRHFGLHRKQARSVHKILNAEFAAICTKIMAEANLAHRTIANYYRNLNGPATTVLFKFEEGSTQASDTIIGDKQDLGLHISIIFLPCSHV